MRGRRRLQARHALLLRGGRRQAARSSPPALNSETSPTPTDQRFDYAASSVGSGIRFDVAAGDSTRSDPKLQAMILLVSKGSDSRDRARGRPIRISEPGHRTVTHFEGTGHV